jgi:hypothetical protein
MAQIGRAHYPSTTPSCPSGVSRLETEHATFYVDPTLILAVMAVEKRPLWLPFRSHYRNYMQSIGQPQVDLWQSAEY